MHPDLQAALAEMSRTRSLLRTAPRRRAPRNFTLTPAMVGSRSPRRRGISWNLFPALSFASALATLALVASIVLQLIPGPQQAAMTAQPQADTTTAAEPNLRAAGEPESAVPEQPFAAPQMEGAAPQAGKMAGEPGVAPPVINWGDPAFQGVGRGGGGGAPDGLGGADTQMGGMGGGAPDGRLMIPPEGVNSLEDLAEPSAAAESAPLEAAEPNPAISGSGPILGVPPAETGGQILEKRSNTGMPVAEQPAQSAEPDQTREEASAQDAAAQDQPMLLGLPRIAALQILLALIAAITGTAAILIRRKAG